MTKGACPFRVGDLVRYQPTKHGFDSDVMSVERLTPGEVYTVEAIQDRSYVVIRGYRHPGEGLYWTEFGPT